MAVKAIGMYSGAYNGRKNNCDFANLIGCALEIQVAVELFAE